MNFYAYIGLTLVALLGIYTMPDPIEAFMERDYRRRKERDRILEMISNGQPFRDTGSYSILFENNGDYIATRYDVWEHKCKYYLLSIPKSRHMFSYMYDEVYSSWELTDVIWRYVKQTVN